MTISTEQFNQVASLLNTTDKSVVFSVCIKTLVESGMPVRDAVDATLGEGRFDAMAGQIYDTLSA